jgi:hypothetical protein
MSQTTFSGPVKSLAGFDSSGAPLKVQTPTALGGLTLTVNAYITIVGQDGTTYYVPVATAAPA